MPSDTNDGHALRCYLIESPAYDFYIIARKPQAFKPGDEWHPERSQQSWRSGGKSGIIWLWPDTQREHIRNIGFNFIWYGYPKTIGEVNEEIVKKYIRNQRKNP